MAIKQTKIITNEEDASGDYSLITKNERDNLLRFINKKDNNSIENYLFKKYKEYYVKDIFDFLNHSFDLLLNFKNKEVLNIGSGEGTESIFFAKFGAKRVYALEKNKDRIEMLKANAKRFCVLKKITPIAGDFTKCKIKESAFDVITMIGVLEWLPKSKPYTEQIMYLKKIIKSLKSEGQFLLAIENRLCPLYFTGKTNHGDLPFTPLMPRFLANFFTKLVKGKKYTTYTYTNTGYKTLLKKAGFRNIRIYPVIFSYQEPRFVLNSCKLYRLLLRKFGIHPLINLGAKLLSYLPCGLLIKLAPAFIVVGEK